MAVSEDVGPTGGVGVVTMPGIPLAPPSASERAVATGSCRW